MSLGYRHASRIGTARGVAQESVPLCPGHCRIFQGEELDQGGKASQASLGTACPCSQLALPEERWEVWSEQVEQVVEACMPGCNPELSVEGREAIWV